MGRESLKVSEGVERALPKWTFRKVRPKKQEAFWLPLHRRAAGGPPHNGSLAVLGPRYDVAQVATPQEGDAGTCVSAAVVTVVQSGVLCAVALEGCWVGGGGVQPVPLACPADCRVDPNKTQTEAPFVPAHIVRVPRVHGACPWRYLPIWVHPHPHWEGSSTASHSLPLPCHHRTCRAACPTHARMNVCVCSFIRLRHLDHI